jgi:hypothetical protein
LVLAGIGVLLLAVAAIQPRLRPLRLGEPYEDDTQLNLSIVGAILLLGISVGYLVLWSSGW